MRPDENLSPARMAELEAWLDSNVYRQNVEFWERAWNMVKSAYTQMPDLSYLPSLPAGLTRAGARTVLDLGCGSGWLSVFLARQRFAVTGVDISPHAIELGRQWAAQEGLDIHFEVGDIARLSYPDGVFDAVVANSIFEHLTHDLATMTLARLKHILVPGGAFVGCFDKVGGGPGEYYELADHTHVYTDKGRKGMMLRNFNDDELRELFASWTVDDFTTTESGTRIVWAHS